MGPQTTSNSWAMQNVAAARSKKNVSAVVAKSKEEAREIATKVEEYSKEGLSSGKFAPFGKL